MIVWLASYPRSGNTFLRVILNSCFKQITYSLHNDEHDIGANEEMVRVTGHEHLPAEFNIEQARESDELMLIKTHAPPPDCDDPVIYLLRDGRESCWSYAHYRVDYHDSESLQQSLEEVIRGDVVFGSWGDHLANWSPESRENALLVRFEEMVAAPEQTISALSDFLQLKVIEASVPSFGELNAINSKFFRSGSTDSWREGFPEYLLELFWLNHEEQMRHYGYDTHTPAVQADRQELFLMLDKLTDQRFSDLRSAAAETTKEKSDANYLKAEEIGLRRFKEDLALVRAELARTQREQVAEKQREIDNLKDQLAEEQLANKNTSEELQKTRSALSEATESNTSAKREIQKLNEHTTRLTKDNESQLHELNKLKELLKKQTGVLSKQSELLESQAAQLNRQTDELTRQMEQLAGLSSARKVLLARVDKLTSESDTLSKELGANTNAMNALLHERKEIFELFEDLASAKAAFSPRLKYRRYGALINKLREQLDSSRA